ncbi:hypothetical protein PG988_005342 [Apiospora saccharicola]
MGADSTNKAWMDPGGAIIDSLRPALYRWKDDFIHRRQLCLDAENRSYFTQESERNEDDDEEIMSVLSKAYEDKYERWAYRLKLLQELCAGLKLRMLRQISLDMGEPVALVFDRDASGRRPLSNGPLTAGRLYKVLSMPRFDVAMAPLAIEEDECDISDALLIPCRAQADQRIIYLTDPNAHSLAVLAATASLPQALPLAGFMADRLSSKPRFSISVSPKGVPVYQMQFQLPFPVFRNRRSEDVANEPSGARSRYTDLAFLTFDLASNGWDASGQEHALCEAMFSCFIHGYDSTRWTAYGLFDTYFDEPDSRESAMRYHEESTSAFAGDPLALAKEDLDTPVACPRHYFLRVLHVRMVRVQDEWWKVVTEVLSMVQIGTGSLNNIGPDAVETLVSIDNSISGLDCLRDDLLHELELLDRGFVQEHEQHTGDLHMFLAQSQQSMSEDVRLLTSANFLFLPVLVAASLCSTQQSPLVVFFAFLVTIAVTILVLGVLRNWRWCLKILKWFKGMMAVEYDAVRILSGNEPILPLRGRTIGSMTTATDQKGISDIMPRLEGRNNPATDECDKLSH